MTTGDIIIQFLIWVPVALGVAGMIILDDFRAGFFCAVVGWCFSVIIFLMISLATFNPTGEFYTYPANQLIIDKLEYGVVIHVKNENGEVTSSLKVNDLKTFELIKDNRFDVKKELKRNVFGDTVYSSPSIYSL